MRILVGDCRETLAGLPAGSAQCCVTSPPYFGLRDYGCAGQIGLEPTPDAYVAELVAVFRAVRRVLADDGVLWLNLGDTYAVSGRGGNPEESAYRKQATNAGSLVKGARVPGLKPKDLTGIPWMVAFALRADGWYLRGDHVWGKPNGMPESVTDRPTRGHEYVFLLSKSEKYFYDAAAVRTAPKASTLTQLAADYAGESTKGHDAAGVQNASDVKRRIVAKMRDKQRGHSRRHDGFNARWDAMEKADQTALGANLRSVWWVPPAQFREAHFAVMPDLVAGICIRSGSRPGDTVLDPFGGAGTTGVVAEWLGREAVICELNPAFAALAESRAAPKWTKSKLAKIDWDS